MMDFPIFVRLEYWSPTGERWWVGHKGVNLMDPQGYVQGAVENNRARRAQQERLGHKIEPPMVMRAVDVETGDIYYPEGGDLL